MQNLFMTSGGKLLANWEEAFAFAQACSDISPVLINKISDVDTVFWLHEENGRHDWLMAGMAAILQKAPEARIVVLSNAPDQRHAFQIMSAGASGYCHAYSAPEVLAEVRSVVAHGGIWLGRELLQKLIQVTARRAGSSSGQVSAALAKLTRRERDVAIEAAQGLSNKAIARKLGITERTVKAHISACFERLGVRDRLQLALILNDKSSHKP